MAFAVAKGPGLRSLMSRTFGLRPYLRRSANSHVFTIQAAPTNDVDLATFNGDLCFDTTNEKIYVASNVGAATTTWTDSALAAL